MIKISNANFNEKMLVKRVEKACFAHLNQPDFFLIDMTVVDEDTIRALNKEARGIDKVTDVLSFRALKNSICPCRKTVSRTAITTETKCF